MKHIPQPQEGEYAAYAAGYVNQYKDGNILESLENNMKVIKDLYNSLPAEKLEYRYAEGKWTLKEVLVHITDVERIFAYRALRIARRDGTPLPSFDENMYIDNAASQNRSLENILHEYEGIRRSTIAMYNGFSDNALDSIGTTSGNPTSVRALAYIIYGHEQHHLNIIKERYLQ